MWRQRVTDALRWMWPGVVPVAVLSVIAAGASFASPTLQRVVTTMTINLVAVLGFYVFIGNSGLFSFAHVGFMAIGAYSAAILSLSPESKALTMPNMPELLSTANLPFLAAVMAGGVVAATVAFVVGLPLLRMRSVALPIATFAVLVIIRTVLIGWKSVTGGVNTMPGIPMQTSPWIAYGFAAAAIAAALVFQTTSIGLRLKGCREDETAARSIGIGAFGERLWAWTLSAFLMGIAGGLFAHQIGILHPDSFWFSSTIMILVMLIAGGMRSLAGAFVGTLGITLISELLRRLEQGFSVGSVEIPARPGLKELAFAVILVAVLIWRRDGLMKGKEFRLPRGLRRPVAAGPVHTAEHGTGANSLETTG